MKGGQADTNIRRALATLAPQLDWQSPTDYVYVIRASNNALAWEFLRRCPEYRADVATWLPTWQALEHRSDGDQFEVWEPVRAEMQRLCTKWGLWWVFGLGIPSSSLPPKFRNLQAPREPDLVAISVGSDSMDCAAELGDYVPSVTIRIHLDQPLNEQMKSARRTVEAIAKGRGLGLPRLSRDDVRRRDDKYARYLQILDARLADVTLSAIARHLYGPDRDSYEAARDDLRAAEELSREGYMRLCRLAPRRRRSERGI